MSNKIYSNNPCPCGSGKKYKNCCGKVAISSSDLKDSFIESMNFLISSSYAYDRGIESEAKRIALEIRKLLHQTNQSTSILHSMGKDDIEFISSVVGEMKETDICWIGIANYTIHVEQYTGKFKYGKCEPMFGNLQNAVNKKNFEDWWKEEVLVDNFKKVYTRSELVLELANKDNGAHVDLELDKEYYETTRNCGIGMRIEQDGQVYEGKDTMNAVIRQIAHEIIFSFYQIEEFKYIKSIMDYVKQY